MDNARYLECLAADYERLREVAVAADPGMAVPSCPEWTVADLVQHVGRVYLHKTLAMREGKEPEPWPPAGLPDEEPVALLDRTYAGMRAEFAKRAPGDAAGGWYAPDRTVGFWIRRMAQETVVHRIDAELGAGVPVAAVPDDLAIDGVDELLRVFLAYSVSEWPDYFTAILDGRTPWTFDIRTHGASWRVRTAPGAVTVEADLGADSGSGAGSQEGSGSGSGSTAVSGSGAQGGSGAGAGSGPRSDSGAVADGDDRAPADATLSAPPAALLRALWKRDIPDAGAPVTRTGPEHAHTLLRACLTVATQ